MSHPYDAYLDRCADEGYGHPIPDDIEKWECRACGLPIGELEYVLDNDEDGWVVRHLECPPEEES